MAVLTLNQQIKNSKVKPTDQKLDKRNKSCINRSKVRLTDQILDQQINRSKVRPKVR